MIARFLRTYGTRPAFIRVLRWLVPVDRFLGRLTRGRFVALGVREIPSLMITTTGRRTGQPRRNPLVYAPDGDSFVVIGSNWGQTHHPSWSTNLLSNPEATVTLKGVDIPVRATHITGPERAELEAKLRAIWPGYEQYERTAGGRHLRIFRLERF